VMVSIAPQRYLLERIGEEHVQVTVLVPAGADPHTFEPSPAQMRALSAAQLYFTVGESFEQVWMDRFLSANPQLHVVDTAAGIERLPMAAGHSHDDEGGETADDEATLDPHIWLSPRIVRTQASTVRNALVSCDPAHAARYDENLAALLADIDALDADIRAMLRDKARREFLVFHPSWAYFAEDYGLEQVAVEVGGQEPSAAELAAVITLARERGIRVVLAQPEFSTTAAGTIAREIDGEVLLVSPLAPDWLENMRRVAATIAQALE